MVLTFKLCQAINENQTSSKLKPFLMKKVREYELDNKG